MYISNNPILVDHSSSFYYDHAVDNVTFKKFYFEILVLFDVDHSIRSFELKRLENYGIISNHG